MARFGIRSRRVLGISVPTIRRIARGLGRDHKLAARLWATGIFEARLLAAMVEDPNRLTSNQMDRWARGFDNWAVTDGCCQDLFYCSKYADEKISTWSRDEREFVKRAAFALIARKAVHGDRVSPAQFRRYLAIIEREARDDRPYVRKAVNWALRQIGKRSRPLNRAAIRSATRIRAQGSRSARWIASDALRELNSVAVQRRLKDRESPRPHRDG